MAIFLHLLTIFVALSIVNSQLTQTEKINEPERCGCDYVKCEPFNLIKCVKFRGKIVLKSLRKCNCCSYCSIKRYNGESCFISHVQMQFVCADRLMCNAEKGVCEESKTITQSDKNDEKINLKFNKRLNHKKLMEFKGKLFSDILEHRLEQIYPKWQWIKKNKKAKILTDLLNLVNHSLTIKRFKRSPLKFGLGLAKKKKVKSGNGSNSTGENQEEEEEEEQQQQSVVNNVNKQVKMIKGGQGNSINQNSGPTFIVNNNYYGYVKGKLKKLENLPEGSQAISVGNLDMGKVEDEGSDDEEKPSICQVPSGDHHERAIKKKKKLKSESGETSDGGGVPRQGNDNNKNVQKNKKNTKKKNTPDDMLPQGNDDNTPKKGKNEKSKDNTPDENNGIVRQDNDDDDDDDAPKNIKNGKSKDSPPDDNDVLHQNTDENPKSKSKNVPKSENNNPKDSAEKYSQTQDSSQKIKDKGNRDNPPDEDSDSHGTIKLKKEYYESNPEDSDGNKPQHDDDRLNDYNNHNERTKSHKENDRNRNVKQNQSPHQLNPQDKDNADGNKPQHDGNGLNQNQNPDQRPNPGDDTDQIRFKHRKSADISNLRDINKDNVERGKNQPEDEDNGFNKNLNPGENPNRGDNTDQISPKFRKSPQISNLQDKDKDNVDRDKNKPEDDDNSRFKKNQHSNHDTDQRPKDTEPSKDSNPQDKDNDRFERKLPDDTNSERPLSDDNSDIETVRRKLKQENDNRDGPKSGHRNIDLNAQNEETIKKSTEMSGVCVNSNDESQRFSKSGKIRHKVTVLTGKRYVKGNAKITETIYKYDGKNWSKIEEDGVPANGPPPDFDVNLINGKIKKPYPGDKAIVIIEEVCLDPGSV